MPHSARRPWQLEQFLERLDAWIELESPPEGVRWIATEWIMSRAEDPYEGATRIVDLPNLWQVRIRGTAHHGTITVCSFWIQETTHTVRCNTFGTLNRPV